MKVSISYVPGEETKALFIVAFIKKFFPKARQKETTKEPPRRHIYFSIKEPLDKRANVQ